MRKIFMIEVKAGHEFDEVKARKAFEDRRVGEEWGQLKASELLEIALKEDPSFSYGFCFTYSVTEMDLCADLLEAIG